MKMLSHLLISYRAAATRLLRKSKIILHITHLNNLNNFGHSLRNLKILLNHKVNKKRRYYKLSRELIAAM